MSTRNRSVKIPAENILPIGESAGYKTSVRATVEMRKKNALRREVDEKHLKFYGGLKEGIGIKTMVWSKACLPVTEFFLPFLASFLLYPSESCRKVSLLCTVAPPSKLHSLEN